MPERVERERSERRNASNWAVPATVSGERMSKRPIGRSHWDHPGKADIGATTREPVDRPVRVAHARTREVPGTD